MNTTGRLPDLLDPVMVADWLTVPPRKVEQMARRGLIPHLVLPGGELVFVADELARWVESLRGGRPEQNV
jgi:hypothetical protein